MKCAKAGWRRLIDGSIGRLLVAGLLAGLVAGCSATALLYERADWLATEYVDGYLDLDDAQAAALRERLVVVHDWHRSEALPRYAEWLDQAHALAAGQPPRARLVALVDSASAHVAAVGTRLADALVPTLMDLGPEQVVYLEAELRERADERRAEYAAADLDDRRSARRQRVLERVEDWVGPLSFAQREQLARLADDMPDVALVWADHREWRDAELLRVLREARDADGLTALMRPWLARTASGDARMDAARAATREALVELLIDIDAMLDADQRTHLRDRLDDFARMARRLSAAS